jgi:hypothetical protein
MKVIGIEIDKSRLVLYALELDDDDNLTNLTGDFITLTLKNDADNSQVGTFKETIHSFFDDINPDVIAILTRQTKGRFKAAPISFKLEGLLQIYEKVDVEFVSPLTLTAYYKKNAFDIEIQHNYQKNAAKLANYLIKR